MPTLRYVKKTYKGIKKGSAAAAFFCHYQFYIYNKRNCFTFFSN